MGTSHRQAPVKDLVGRIRAGLGELFALPDGYEVALGNGGTTAFWDAAAAGLVRERALHLTYGEFSQKFAKATAGAPFLADPIVVEAEPGDAPDAGRRPGRRRARLGPQRDLDRRDGRRSSARRAPATRWSWSTRPPAPAACRSTPPRPTPTTSPRRRPSAPTAASGWRCSARRRSSGSSELDGAAGRWQPAFLSLPTALDNSRKDQTYNTPAVATLLLLADQIEWMLGRRRPRLVRASAPRARPAHLYGWAEAAEFATPFVADPAKRSLVVGTIDFDDSVDAAALAATLRANGIVDTEPYRKLGRNQLRIGMFPAVDPADVEALTACIDWVVENAEGRR